MHSAGCPRGVSPSSPPGCGPHGAGLRGVVPISPVYCILLPPLCLNMIFAFLRAHVRAFVISHVYLLLWFAESSAQWCRCSFNGVRGPTLALVKPVPLPPEINRLLSARFSLEFIVRLFLIYKPDWN
jgi:hypothetical protein